MPRIQDPDDPIWNSNYRLCFAKFGLAMSESEPTGLTNARFPARIREADHPYNQAIDRLIRNELPALGEVFINNEAGETRNHQRFPKFSKSRPVFGVVTGLFIDTRVSERNTDADPYEHRSEWQIRMTSSTTPTYDTLWWLSSFSQKFRRPPGVLRNERLISRSVRPRSPRGTNETERIAVSWGGPPLMSFSTLDPEFVRHVRQAIDEYARDYLAVYNLNAMRPASSVPTESAVPCEPSTTLSSDEARVPQAWSEPVATAGATTSEAYDAWTRRMINNMSGAQPARPRGTTVTFRNGLAQATEPVAAIPTTPPPSAISSLPASEYYFSDEAPRYLEDDNV